MTPQPLRIALYSHDSQGLGHLRRNLAIAHHLGRDLPQLTGRDVTGLIISGLAPTMNLPLPPGFDWLTIPGVAKGESGYRPRNLLEATADLIHLRSGLLDAALLGFAPDLLIIDRHIFGVWQELRAPLHRLQARHPLTRIVLGLREVLDESRRVAAEWQAIGDTDALGTLIDEVWVYGDPAVHDLVHLGQIPASLVGRTRFTGYLAAGRELADRPAQMIKQPYILTTVGGGSDGQAVLDACLGVVPPPGFRHVIVAGPQAPVHMVDDLSSSLGPNTEVHHSLSGLSAQIAGASAVISMGGYNTMCEILASRTPALIIPRTTPRAEQAIRADALARVGVVDVLNKTQLTTGALETWLAGAIGRRVARDGVDRDGLGRLSAFAAALIQPCELEVGVQ